MLLMCEIRENPLFSALYLSDNQRVTNRLVKGALLHCKRAPFTHQKGMFCNAKGHLLPCNMPPITFEKTKKFYISRN